MPVAVAPSALPETAQETCTPTLRELLLGFGVLSVVSVGGGTAAWAHKLFVVRRRWMTNDAFLEARALAQVLPGPNMINFSVYVGAHFHGALGAVLAFLGLTTIPIALIMTFAIWYLHGGNIPSGDAVLSGLAAAAVGSSFGTAFDSGRKHFREPLFTAIVACVFVLVGVMRWSLVWVTLAATAVSLVAYRPRSLQPPATHAAAVGDPADHADGEGA